jgi:hypothetical protein
MSDADTIDRPGEAVVGSAKPAGQTAGRIPENTQDDTVDSNVLTDAERQEFERLVERGQNEYLVYKASLLYALHGQVETYKAAIDKPAKWAIFVKEKGLRGDLARTQVAEFMVMRDGDEDLSEELLRNRRALWGRGIAWFATPALCPFSDADEAVDHACAHGWVKGIAAEYLNFTNPSKDPAKPPPRMSKAERGDHLRQVQDIRRQRREEAAQPKTTIHERFREYVKTHPWNHEAAAELARQEAKAKPAEPPPPLQQEMDTEDDETDDDRLGFLPGEEFWVVGYDYMLRYFISEEAARTAAKAAEEAAALDRPAGQTAGHEPCITCEHPAGFEFVRSEHYVDADGEYQLGPSWWQPEPFPEPEPREAHGTASPTPPHSPTPAPAPVNAQDWLTRLAQAMRPVFEDASYPFPDRFCVTVGHTSRGDRYGEAHARSETRDGTGNIYISPYLADPIRIGEILIHELVHLVVGVENDHDETFKACADRIDLVGEVTSTLAGSDLMPRLRAMIEELGEYPYSPLIERPPQIAEKESSPPVVGIDPHELILTGDPLPKLLPTDDKMEKAREIVERVFHPGNSVGDVLAGVRGYHRLVPGWGPSDLDVGSYRQMIDKKNDKIRELLDANMKLIDSNSRLREEVADLKKQLNSRPPVKQRA